MANSVTPPDPKIPLLYFMFLSMIYGILSVTNILNIDNKEILTYEGKIDNIALNKNNTVINIIYILFLVTGTYFININLYNKFCSNLDSVSTPHSKLIIITLFPWIIIFGILYFVLELFPGWIKPFSNTIGYFVVNVLGVENQLINILNDPGSESASPSVPVSPSEPAPASESVVAPENKIRTNKDIVLAINNIKKDRVKFINELDSNDENYIQFMNDMTRAELFKKDNNAFAQIYKYIIIKDIIGKITWYILAGSLIASITYNYIINLSCSKSDDDPISNMLDEYDKYIDGIKYGYKWKRIIESSSTGGKDITDKTDVVKLTTKYIDKFKKEQANVNITSDEVLNAGIIHPLYTGLKDDLVFITVNDSDNSKLLYYQLKE